MRALVIAATLLVIAAGCAADEGEDATRTSGATIADEPAPSTETGGQGSNTERGGPLRAQRFVSGLDDPVYLTFAAGEPGRLYVVEQGGRIVIVEGGKPSRTSFLDISGEIVAGGEQGLLGLAFHPEYASNRLLYVHFTDDAGDTRVVEYRARANGRSVDESSARMLFEADQPYANHNGGQLAFGPDGRLWLGLGDGGSGGDPENRAQDLSSPLGKIHAIDVDGREPKSEIVAYGLRNPWRFSFDRASSDLWIGDVGQSEFEEIDRLPAGEVGELVNFGWDAFEGRERFEDKEPTAEGTLVEPTVVYSHSQGCSVTGGYVYRGEDVPAAQGRYFYGDYCSGRVWSTGPGGNVRSEPFEVGGLVSFGEDAAGELYLVSLGGTIFRLTD